MRYLFSVSTLLFLLSSALLLCGCSQPASRSLVNVSYDPTREFYKAYNAQFVAEWEKTHQEKIVVKQSHGGSGAQARSVANGQEADVVTLALGHDVNLLIAPKLLAPDWQTRLPHNSAPYTSTIVFMVRSGNPKKIGDWEDLLQDGIEIITPNPKTSGGARWNYLAAWGAILQRELGGDWSKLNNPEAQEEVAAAQTKAREFVAAIFKKVKTMDTGARESTNRFVQNRQGDVFLAWENEALLAQQMRSKDGLEIVVPNCSILCEPPVAVVDAVVERRGTRDLAEAYLEGLYADEGQELIVKYHYRPSNEEILAKHPDAFPVVQRFSIAEVFGGWSRAQKEHFDADGIFDQMTMENVK